MQKKYLTNYNSLIVQDLWQAHNQILLIFLLKEFIKLNVNTDIIIKKCETCGIKYKNCECCLEYTSVKDDLIEYKCLCCNMNYHKKFDENLRKNLANAYKFFNQDIKKFILLLCLSLQIHGWLGNFNETSLPQKDDCYSPLNMEDITDVDYTHAK